MKTLSASEVNITPIESRNEEKMNNKGKVKVKEESRNVQENTKTNSEPSSMNPEEMNAEENKQMFFKQRLSEKKKSGRYANKQSWKIWDFPDRYENEDHRIYSYLILLEIFLYSLFIASTTTVVLGSTNYTTYFYSIILSDVLTKTTFINGNNFQTNFRNLKTIEELWIFIKEVYLQEVYKENMGDLMYVLGNLVIGVPRTRQVRVKPDSCKIPSEFEGMFNDCYNYYSYSSEDREPFGEGSGST